MKMQYRQLGPGLVQQIQAVCTKCAGQGNVIPEKDRCKKCSGSKICAETKDIEVHVDKGMSHGSKIVVRGEGDEEVCEFYCQKRFIC
jgi:DnaJ-class molecular chaperone